MTIAELEKIDCNDYSFNVCMASILPIGTVVSKLESCVFKKGCINYTNIKFVSQMCRKMNLYFL